MNSLFSSVYLGNILYYSEFIHGIQSTIECHENYIKQTYRNRCEILSANGRLLLVIPVRKKSGHKQKISEVQIEYAENWQKQHWNTICSSYNSSPYFEYYDYLFEPFYTSKIDKLLDFNLALHKLILKCLNVSDNTNLTTEFSEYEYNKLDRRKNISPKKMVSLPQITYYQTFSEKIPFQSNLSIIDLLFNEGPNSLQFLKDFYQKNNYTCI